jgi:heptosyltransferase II
MSFSPKRVLVIQTAFIGDIIMSTPLFSGIHQAYPDAMVDVVVNSRHTSLLDNNPFISKVYGFDKSKNKLWHLFLLIREIRKNRYDLALSMQIHASSTLMMVLGGIKKRIGFPRQSLLTHPVESAPGMHIRERAGLLLNEMKQGTYDLQTRLYPTPGDLAKAKQLIREEKKFSLGIAPGSVWETKKWPKDYYIDVIKELSEEASIYLIGGGAEDVALCKEIVLRSEVSDIVDTSGKLSLLQSAALIAQLDLVLCNDSAPLHMANAMETPVIAIFGPTVKRFGCYPYQPFDTLMDIDLYCRPCSKHGGKVCPEGHFRCMKDIPPQRVITEIKKNMQQAGIIRPSPNP